MLFIVAHHYVVNSGLTAIDGPIYSAPMSWRSIFLLLFGAWGKVGINCFVFITGYFMCKSWITAKKFVKLVFMVELYKAIFYIIFLIVGYESLSVVSFAKMILPVTGVKTGFVGCYLLFFLCIPFLNVLLGNINERQHIRLILLTGFIYVILGTAPKINVSMNYVSWFIVLYFISSYVRLYPKKCFNNAWLWGWLALLSFIISAISVVACTWLGSKIGRPELSYYFVNDSNKILAVTTAFCAFMFFKNVNLKYSKFINIVAYSAFGVLLIHANSDAMRQWLWKDTLNNVGAYGSNMLPLHAIGSVLGIYIICTAIDQLRIRFVETPFLKLWDRHWNKISEWYKKKSEMLYRKILVKDKKA